MDKEQITLRDGAAVLIRPVQPEDKQLFVLPHHGAAHGRQGPPPAILSTWTA